MQRRFLKIINLFKKNVSNNLSIVIAVILALILLLVMNYYTIRILSGTSAYMAGESFYSKGQKDASMNLLLYIDSEDEKYWHLFKENIAIPLSDKQARIELLNKNYKEAEKLIIKGMNHPEDAPLIVWLFKWFKEFNFMKRPISIWTNADSIITNTYNLGEQINESLNSSVVTKKEKDELKTLVYRNNEKLTKLENQFLASLAITSRTLRKLILLINTSFIIAIVIGQSLFSLRAVNNLGRSRRDLIEQNKELKSTNHELDRFVYSASHDLRAPISSLKGLANLMRLETTSSTLANYIDLMEKSLEKQDAFIRKIISFSQNKRSSLQISNVNIEEVINEVLDQLRFGQDFMKITIKKDISVKSYQTDVTRLEIILNNLISNACKYQDKSKQDNWIKIISFIQNNRLIINVIDNGIGIDEANQGNVFDLFYRSTSMSEGSGVGLYIVKEAVEKLEGKITMTSIKGMGTSFTITL